jgi:hypothetical protein
MNTSSYKGTDSRTYNLRLTDGDDDDDDAMVRGGDYDNDDEKFVLKIRFSVI